MWSQIKSFIATLGLTLLIWLAADQNVTDSVRMEIPVRLAADDRYAVIVQPARVVNFSMTLTGRRRRLSEFRERLESRKPSPFESQVDRSQRSSSEPQVMVASEVLRQVRELVGAGLTVSDIDPPNVTVLVDDYEVVQEIAVNPNYGTLRVDASCSPPKVSARLPRFAAGSLQREKIIRVDAEGAVREAKAARPDDRTFTATLRLPTEINGDIPIGFTPSEVTLQGGVEALTETKRVGPVQIKFLIPDEVQQKFRVVPAAGSNFRPDIDVVGPPSSLARLETRDIRGLVEIKASDVDQAGQEIPRNAVFDLPRDLPGLAISADAPPHQIVFVLVPREAAEPNGE